MRRGLFAFSVFFAIGWLTPCQASPPTLQSSPDAVGPSSNATTEGKLAEARAAFDRTDYSTAATIWRPLAEQGNPAAEMGMGELFDFGWGAPKDRIRATYWYQRAADQGFAEGECTIGLGYVVGDVPPHDVTRGLTLMRQAVDHGSGHCAVSIGELYRLGLFGVPKDMVQAAAWHRRGAEMGDVIAEGRLGIDYQFGLGVEQNSARAMYWYRKEVEQTRKAAEQGDAMAQLSLGEAYALGTSGLTKDKTAARYWCGKAAQQRSRAKTFAEQCVSLTK
jgi:uncharacterized protein